MPCAGPHVLKCGPLPALAFRRWLGGEAVINAYCRDLAIKGGKRLAELLGTKVMDETGELTLSMVRRNAVY